MTKVERDDWKARALEAEPVAWLVTGPYEKRAFDMRGFAEAYCSGLNKGAGENIYKVSDLVMSIGEHEKCTDERMCIACFSGQGKCENPTPPQPAAQEPTSAVPVVEQLVEALDGLFTGDVVVWSLGGSARPRAAIAAGQQYLKENGK